jgi:hypothetical protein
MSVQIDLPEKLAGWLSNEAARLNLSLNEFAVQILNEKAVCANEMPTNGRDLVQYWRDRGLIGSRKIVGDSADIASNLRRKAEERAS